MKTRMQTNFDLLELENNQNILWKYN